MQSGRNTSYLHLAVLGDRVTMLSIQWSGCAQARQIHSAGILFTTSDQYASKTEMTEMSDDTLIKNDSSYKQAPYWL